MRDFTQVAFSARRTRTIAAVTGTSRGVLFLIVGFVLTTAGLVVTNYRGARDWLL